MYVYIYIYTYIYMKTNLIFELILLNVPAFLLLNLKC